MKKGFTLIELMVSVSIFAVVLLITISAVLSILDANRKAQSLSSVMDNLNASLESMTRNIKTNHGYNIGANNESITVLVDDNDINTEDETLSYNFLDVAGKGSIQLSSGFDDPIDITAPEVDIDLFKVVKLEPSDECSQPKILMVVIGEAGANTRTKTKFSIQSVVSQRDFDLNASCLSSSI